MKKIFMAAITAGMLTTGAFANILGTIGTVDVKNDGTIKIVINKTTGGSTYAQELVGTAEAIKSMYAMVLTAKSLGTVVDVTLGADSTTGTTGWKRIILQ